MDIADTSLLVDDWFGNYTPQIGDFNDPRTGNHVLNQPG